MEDYSKITEDEIRDDALSQIPNDIDKRQGSVAYIFVSIAAYLVKKAYDFLQRVQMNLFLETMDSESLDKYAWSLKIVRQPATPARRLLTIYSTYYSVDSEENVLKTDVEIGTRFITREQGANNNLVYAIDTNNGDGTYIATCETAGSIGNESYGEMSPVTNYSSIQYVWMSAEVVTYGTDVENDDAFRERLRQYLTGGGFGGNWDDYRNWIATNFPDVGRIQVYTAFNGNVVGSLLGVNDQQLSQTRLDEITGIMDAITASEKQLGFGITPVGHRFQAVSPDFTQITINVSNIVPFSGTTIEQAMANASSNLESYIDAIHNQWAQRNNGGYTPIIVQYSLVQSAVVAFSNGISSADVVLNGGTVDVSASDKTVLDIVTYNFPQFTVTVSP